MPTFEIDGDRFLRDGRPWRVLSGALHYFRLHPDQWSRQLRMLRSMGLNTVETYVPWNLHERREGEYSFDGMADLPRFLDAAKAEDLDVIVRPGPYICAEWENGGIPAWVSARVGTRIRCSDTAWLTALDRWFDALIPIVADAQITRGGRVTMVQVENEYGSFGNDAGYLEYVRDGLIRRGIDSILFTSDGPEAAMLNGGLVDGTLATLNFGSGTAGAFDALEAVRPGSPKFVMEFWDGWFDHWGDPHVTRSVDDAAAVLREILDAGASVNLYMAQGGTNFGPWAGANRAGDLHDGALQPTITSYDYDAPIDERGAPTEKYWRFRELLDDARRADGDSSDLPDPPADVPTVSSRSFSLTPAGTLIGRFESEGIDAPDPHPHPSAFDELGVDQGVGWYSLHVGGPRPAEMLRLDGVADRASVWLGETLIHRADGPQIAVALPPVPHDGARIDVVVTSYGRTNYGPALGELKGWTGRARHGRQFVHGVTSRAIPLDSAPTARDLDAGSGRTAALDGAPEYLVGHFDAEIVGDARIALDGIERAVVWINGFCLGRLDAVGPQLSLHVPWPLVHEGRNDVLVLDLEPQPRAERDATNFGGPRRGRVVAGDEAWAATS